jgi:5-methylcytosine-specific restriction endonuclease McrA
MKSKRQRRRRPYKSRRAKDDGAPSVIPPGHAPRFYWTHEWRNLRREVLIRDEMTCQYCGDAAVTADHIIPRKHGGPDAAINLMAVCGECNKLAASRYFEEFREKREWIRAQRGLPARRIRLSGKRPLTSP